VEDNVIASPTTRHVTHIACRAKRLFASVCGRGERRNAHERSQKTVHAGCEPARMQSSSSLLNGSSSGGGLLVFFPTSPSSSSNNSAGAALHGRRESHTDETAEEAVAWSAANDMSDEMMADEEMIVDDVSMKDVEMTTCAKSLKRPPDFNGSNNTGSSMCNAMPNAVQAANSYSPRQRPLFVDTQMANMDSLKRRSPVSQVVDFVRGRNRTYSLQLSSSPMMSPQSVASRASASCDTQPANSPCGRRQTVSGRVHRSSFTASGLKSFDSGLDLSSPTINHTALLIKERVSRFPRKASVSPSLSLLLVSLFPTSRVTTRAISNSTKEKKKGGEDGKKKKKKTSVRLVKKQ
uniref:Uncharacterized protein n=2 Tax=Caenorhabditis japonica TaxID=281687 RepID=A0A8R1I1B2_CAEJA